MQPPFEELDEKMNQRIQAEKYQLEARQRFRVASIVIPVFLAFIAYSISQYGWMFGMSDSNSTILQVTALVMLGASGGFGILIYLQTGFKSAKHQLDEALSISRHESSQSFLTEEIKSETELAIKQIREAHSALERKFMEMEQLHSVSAQLGEEDKTALIASLKAQLTSETAKAVISEIESNLAATLRRENRERNILLRFEESRSRLSTELQALGFRGNVNLALGAITTVIGLSLLGWSVFQEVASSIKEPWEMASHFVPRLSLVVLIELFAFFFLSLYKTSLAEIKYFQNELTNVEAKQIALRTAIDYGDATMITAMVSSLASTERNHVLTKDQTTVELEKARIEREGRGDLVKVLQDLVKGKKD